ncbi:MAG: DUF2461 domain-containing protein [Mucinivorans sp.]
MNRIVDFLDEIKANNNREWFNQNKSRYLVIQAQFNELTASLIEGIARFDPMVAGLEVKDCLYRIYRDVRFSPNKEPYKTHMGAYICPGGKKSGLAGYYFHLEPGCSLLASGLHCPDKAVVRSVRDEIFANGAVFEQALSGATGFALDMSDALKRVPRDYPADSPFGNYLRLKEFDLVKPLELSGDVLGRTLEDFSRCTAFNYLLNRAVEYAQNESR